jgi:DNA-binding transcriptional MerR regulator
MQYKPSDAAKACNTSVNTIRNWCRDYAVFLSPGARGNGANRILTDKDLNTLKYIAQLRAENLQQAAIAQRLQETSIGEVETLVALQGPSIGPPPPEEMKELAPVAAQEGLQQAQGLVVALEAMQRQIDAIQQAAQHADRRRFDTVTVLGIGICIGLLFAAILIGLAYLYGSP